MSYLRPSLVQRIKAAMRKEGQVPLMIVVVGQSGVGMVHTGFLDGFQAGSPMVERLLRESKEIFQGNTGAHQDFLRFLSEDEY